MTTLYDQAREKLAAISARDIELRAWEVEFSRTDQEYYDWFLDQVREGRTAK